MEASDDTSPDNILLTSLRVFPGIITFRSSFSSFSAILRIDILWPSSEITLKVLFFISNNSPVIILLLSLSDMENTVCLIISFKANWDKTRGFSFSISGRYGNSSPDLPDIENLAFSHTISVTKLLSAEIVTSFSGSLLMISEKTLAFRATVPFSMIFPLTRVSIPSSISFAISFILSPVASITRHSSMGMVVLTGTAFRTIFTLFNKSDFWQTIFICL